MYMDLKGDERKQYIDFIRNIDQFFNGSYLSENNPTTKVSSQMGGRYEGGVEIKGAKYVIYIGTGRYFVFVDFAERIVDFKTVKAVEPGKFGAVSVGQLMVGDIGDDSGKNVFAKEIVEFLLTVKDKGRSISKK
jgi:hypothetical protein